ncbi:hypothetical protein ABH935_005694 [Catenulispora sp. GAS73]
MGYVLAVPKSQQVRTDVGIWRIDQVIGAAPEQAGLRISAGDGAKGPRLYDWAAARLPYVPDFDDLNDGGPVVTRRILARRPLGEGEIAPPTCTSPSAANLNALSPPRDPSRPTPHAWVTHHEP